MCRPFVAIDRSAGGLQRHPILVVVVYGYEKGVVEAELDLTNERFEMQGSW